MKLIFLHGLGQSADSWKEVQDFLTDYPSEALELFPSGVATYQEAKEWHLSALVRGDRTFCLNRFVLRGCTCIRASSYDLPNLQALVCQDVH